MLLSVDVYFQANQLWRHQVQPPISWVTQWKWFVANGQSITSLIDDKVYIARAIDVAQLVRVTLDERNLDRSLVYLRKWSAEHYAQVALAP